MAIGLCLGAADLDAAEPSDAPFAQLGPVVVEGSEPSLLQLGLGTFDVTSEDAAPAANLEYRLGRKLGFIGPALGLMANGDGGVYGYVGLYADLALGPAHLVPLLAAGAYHEGAGKDLGGVFEFRESVDLAYSFDRGMRLGLRVAHMSNAGINDRNPGVEEIMMVLAIPLGPKL
jgi:hypothetical protein